MKRTLKRGLKVREIAKREAIGFSMGMYPNRVSCRYKRFTRTGRFTSIPCGFMKLTPVLYFWYVLVSIGSLALVIERLGHGRPTAVG